MRIVHINDENEGFIAFKQGDESALSYFIDLYYPRLCIYAERKAGTGSVAEDIVEEAFIKLWKKRSDFDSLPEMKSFLYVIIRHACFNYIKKQKKDKYHNGEFAYLQSNSDDQLEIIRTEALAAIYNAIDTLPEKCQEIFKMSYLEGKKNDQIAHSLNLSVQTVKNQKLRALKMLQFHFKHKKDLLHLTTAGIIFLQ